MNTARTLHAPQREPDGMHFLKTLFWVLVAVVVVLFAVRNWAPVTLNLWGDIEADVNLPLLLLLFFLIGFLPTWIVMRTRIWSHRRRVGAFGRERVSTPPQPLSDEEEPLE